MLINLAESDFMATFAPDLRNKVINNLKKGNNMDKREYKELIGSIALLIVFMVAAYAALWILY